MPQTHIRKGFFFYFGLFILLLIAIFMVCLVIMMFNPGKTILWMEYFTADSQTFVDKTTDENNKQTINWDNIKNVKISCTYAQVRVQVNQYEFDNSGLYIINRAKGFAISSNATPFHYDVRYEGSDTLRIEVVEESGFIYFSKDVQIVLNSTFLSNLDMENINLEIQTTSGEVSIGEVNIIDDDADNLKLASVNVETNDGDVVFGNHFDTSTLKSLSFTTKEGTIRSTKDISTELSVNGSTRTVRAKGIDTNCDVNLDTTDGRIEIDLIDVGANDLNILSRKGDWYIENVKAQNVNVSCVQGRYYIDNVDGNLDFTKAESSLLAPIINVDYISGNFNLSVNEGNPDVEPTIDIARIDGDLNVLLDKGSVKVDEANGVISIESSVNAGIDITVGANNSEIKRIINGSGAIKVSFLKDVSGTNNTFTTDTGNIDINFTNLANFRSTANNGEGTLLSDDKISVSHGLIEGISKNPLTVGNGGGSLLIKTDGKLSYNLVSSDSLDND